jgi:hypothetical protein
VGSRVQVCLILVDSRVLVVVGKKGRSLQVSIGSVFMWLVVGYTRCLVKLLNILPSLLQALRSFESHFLLSCVTGRILRVVGVLSSCPGRRARKEDSGMRCCKKVPRSSEFPGSRTQLEM